MRKYINTLYFHQWTIITGCKIIQRIRYLDKKTLPIFLRSCPINYLFIYSFIAQERIMIRGKHLTDRFQSSPTDH